MITVLHKMSKSKIAPQKESVLLDQFIQGFRQRRVIHPLKVEEVMSSVDKSTIEDLQKKDSTLKKCFDQIGKPIIRENYMYV